MITVKMVRDMGFKFVEGDSVYFHGAGEIVQASRVDAECVNSNLTDERSEVGGFAWRESKGAMPCDGELLVDVQYFDDLAEALDSAEFVDPKHATLKSKLVAWGSPSIHKWRPSLENWKSEKIQSGESKVEHLNLVVKLENQQQVDVVNKIWRDSNIEPERIITGDGFIGEVKRQFPIVAYFDCDWLEFGNTCGWDYFKDRLHLNSAIDLNGFSGFLKKVKHLIEQVETPEEKEAFDSMEKSQDSSELNGEGLPPVGVECEIKFKHLSCASWDKCKVFAYSGDVVAAIWHFDGEEWNHCTVNVADYDFRKLETPQQREERENLELAYELYCAANNETVGRPVSFGAFRHGLSDNNVWLAAAKRAKELLAK